MHVSRARLLVWRARLVWRWHKTELVAVLTGMKKREAGARLASNRDADGVQCLPLACGGHLRVVPAYRHLGAVATSGAALSQDVAKRTAAAHLATTALRRSVLSRDQIQRNAKVAVAKACVHSRGLYLAGLWGLLPAGLMGRFNAAMMRPYRVILGLNRAPEDGQHVGNAEVLRVLRQPSPAWTLLLARAAAGIRLSLRAPDYIRGLLQGRGGEEWRFALTRSLAALQRLMAPKLEAMPSPMLDPAAWEVAWRAAPAAWQAILHKATQLAGTDPDRAAAVLADFPELNVAPDDDGGSDPDEVMCMHCAECFTTPAGATIHRLKAHADLPNLPLAIRQSVVDATCPACHLGFHQRLRVLHHLRRRGGVDSDCRRRVLSGEFAGHPAEAIAAADALDAAHRRACRAAGRHVLAGPTCAPAAP